MRFRANATEMGQPVHSSKWELTKEMKFRLPVLLFGAIRAYGILLEEYFAKPTEEKQEKDELSDLDMK